MANEAATRATEVASKDMEKPLNANDAFTRLYWAASEANLAGFLYI